MILTKIFSNVILYKSDKEVEAIEKSLDILKLKI